MTHEQAQTPSNEVIDQTFWPDATAFLDLSSADQLTVGKAYCTAVAVCDSTGHPTKTFKQGQAAHFFYEFELREDCAAVAGGLEFCDSTGFCIHGKNTFQYGTATPEVIPAGTRLRFHHVLHLELGPGEFYFSVGLATADAQIYSRYRKGELGEAMFSPTVRELCRMVKVGSFQIVVERTDRLLHHGFVNLPGVCQWSALPAEETARNASIPPVRTASSIGEPAPRQAAAPAHQAASAPAIIRNTAQDIPTLFHITHWKAGSQWIHKILLALVPDRIVAPQDAEVQFLHWPIQPGKVYPTVYIPKHHFDTVRQPAPWCRFVVIRDLRDTLISAYFSLKFSHPKTSYNDPFYTKLQELDMEAGLVHLMDQWLPMCAHIQRTWLEADERLLRYEDLLEHDLEILEPLLLEEARLPVSRDQVRAAILKNRFERLTRGRARGQIDINAHERKGISGDWRNYLSEPLKRKFKSRFGGTLIATGYERDLNW